MGLTRQKQTLAASTPDYRLREDCDIIEKLGEKVKLLVTATSVQAMRAEELKAYENEPLWRDNDVVIEVSRQVSIEEKQSELKSKITELFYDGIPQASPRLENLAYVLRGVNMVFRSPWLRLRLPEREEEWLYIFETGLNADDLFRPHERKETEDLSLKQLP